jgi:hypothetical protein
MEDPMRDATKLIELYQVERDMSDEQLCNLLGVNDVALAAWRSGAEMPLAAAIVMILYGEQLITDEDIGLAKEVAASY